MSGPKHLWAGDWEDESAAAADELAPISAPHAAPARQEPVPAPRTREQPPAPPTPERRPRRRLSPAARRAAPILLAVIVVVAGAAYGLTALFHGSGSRQAPVSPSGGAALPAATPPVGSTKPIMWLGMEIVTAPPGVAVVETVRQGSAGDQAGLSPGDVILQIDNRSVGGASAIAAAIHGLQKGDSVHLLVSHGSSLYDTHATLTGPPSAYP
jgi:membrane-associated protease RseP (regulator of RpoE activity)